MVLELQGCRISRVAGFLRLQVSTVSKLSELGVPEQKPFAGALAGMPRKNSL